MTETFNSHTGNIRDPRRLEKFIVSKTSSGRTILTRKPLSDPRPAFNGSQKSMRKIVRLAVTYAEFASEQAIYQSKAVGTSNSAYLLAVADYLEKPTVLDVDLRDWSEGVGQKIHIQAKDNFMVLNVRLVIREGDCILEEGEAVQSVSNSLVWTYTTKTYVAREPGLTLDAFAYDLPGNVGAYQVELR